MKNVSSLILPEMFLIILIFILQKSKSLTAANAVLNINKDLKIEAHQYKVGPETTASNYHDEFFRAQNVIVNALVCYFRAL